MLWTQLDHFCNTAIGWCPYGFFQNLSPWEEADLKNRETKVLRPSHYKHVFYAAIPNLFGCSRASLLCFHSRDRSVLGTDWSSFMNIDTCDDTLVDFIHIHYMQRQHPA